MKWALPAIRWQKSLEVFPCEEHQIEMVSGVRAVSSRPNSYRFAHRLCPERDSATCADHNYGCAGRNYKGANHDIGCASHNYEGPDNDYGSACHDCGCAHHDRWLDNAYLYDYQASGHAHKSVDVDNHDQECHRHD